MVTYYAFLLASILAPKVPRTAGYALCDALGSVAWALSHHRRAIVAANLAHVLGDAKRVTPGVVRQVFRYGARSNFDTLLLSSLSREDLHSWVQVRGLENLDQALRAGRGAILAGAHLSSLSLAGQIISVSGYPTTIVVEAMAEPRLHRLINRFRAAHGIEVLQLGDPALARTLLERLRQNRVLGLVVDRDVAGTGELVQFFDAPARLPVGPARLSLHSGAPILPSVVLHSGRGKFVGFVEPPIAIERSDDRQRDVPELTRRVIQRLEYYIGRAPGQWAIFDPVWRDGMNRAGGSKGVKA